MKSNETRLPTLREAFLVIFVSFTLALLAQLFEFPFLGKGKLLLSELVLLIPVLVFVSIKRLSFQPVFRWQPANLRLLVAGGIIGLGMSPVSDELDRLVQSLIPMPPDIFKALESVMRFQSTGEMILLIWTLVIIGPVAEEMLFRGLLQGAFERNTNINKAVFSTAFIFMFIHFNPWWAIQILVVGVLLGVLAWRTDSILPCMIMHGVINGISLAVINIPAGKLNGYEYKGHVAPWWVLSGVGLIYFGFKWVYRLTEKDFKRPV